MPVYNLLNGATAAQPSQKCLLHGSEQNSPQAKAAIKAAIFAAKKRL